MTDAGKGHGSMSPKACHQQLHIKQAGAGWCMLRQKGGHAYMHVCIYVCLISSTMQ